MLVPNNLSVERLSRQPGAQCPSAPRRETGHGRRDRLATCAVKKNRSNALEVLKKENELLKEVIGNPSATADDLKKAEAQLKASAGMVEELAGTSSPSSARPLSSNGAPPSTSNGAKKPSAAHSPSTAAPPLGAGSPAIEEDPSDIIEAATAQDSYVEGGAVGGVAESLPEAASAKDPSSPEEFWMPEAPAVPGGFVETYGAIPSTPGHDGTECLKWDDSLWSHADHFKNRWNQLKGVRHAIDQNEGGLEKFSQGYLYYGFNRGSHEGREGIWYREWAPAARALALVGEFNNWDPQPEHWAVKNTFGTWNLFLADKPDGTPAIPHRSKIKCKVETGYGEWVERIPAWIKWATQEWNEVQFNGVYYEPPNKGEPGAIPSDQSTSYTFKYPRPARPRALRIYEAHVGMSSVEPKVNSYLEFRRDMLPRIRALGYNAIQLMAVQEHAYYGSFGYHVTNFFAASSRCGSPDELKALIDEAHRLGLVVLMDVVHSHASSNTNDGINMFDGTDGMYFHGGARGYHWMWDSRCFNYGTWETLRFLLSNSRWWMDEYKFDGYRFDGVTSMMYHHHGLQMTFTGNYGEYFGDSTDVEAVVYLQLVNQLLHGLFPTAITIGEDVSGMPTFCRPVEEGGVGFDYRLQMAIADKWIELLSEVRDHEWEMGNITHTLTNRRYAEACVAYAESHDQALVGDKTIAFWLMDAAMYDKMATSTSSVEVDRGIALHKMIRLITMCLGGESYLNFMGNEFGHPEWVDFPRDDTIDPSTREHVPGNGGSYEKCRRRWDLADSPELKYRFMNAWDRAFNHLDKAFGFLPSPHQYISRKDEGDKLIVVERGDLVFVFNFHWSQSFTDYRIGCRDSGSYKVVLSSDEPVFGGWSNLSKENDTEHSTEEGLHDGRPHSFLAYCPSRTVAVYAPAAQVDSKADQKPLGIPGLGVRGHGPHFAP